MASTAPGVTSTIGTPPFCGWARSLRACRVVFAASLAGSSPRSLRRARLLGRRQLCKRLLLAQPGDIILLRIDRDRAAHEGVALAAQLGAQHLEVAGPRRREPVVGD